MSANDLTKKGGNSAKAATPGTFNPNLKKETQLNTNVGMRPTSSHITKLRGRPLFGREIMTTTKESLVNTLLTKKLSLASRLFEIRSKIEETNELDKPSLLKISTELMNLFTSLNKAENMTQVDEIESSLNSLEIVLPSNETTLRPEKRTSSVLRSLTSPKPRVVSTHPDVAPISIDDNVSFLDNNTVAEPTKSIHAFQHRLSESLSENQTKEDHTTKLSNLHMSETKPISNKETGGTNEQLTTILPEVAGTWPSYIVKNNEGKWISLRNRTKEELPHQERWEEEYLLGEKALTAYLQFMNEGSEENKKRKILNYRDLTDLQDKYRALLGDEKLEEAEVLRKQLSLKTEAYIKNWSEINKGIISTEELLLIYESVAQEFREQKERASLLMEHVSKHEKDKLQELENQITRLDGRVDMGIQNNGISGEDSNLLSSLRSKVRAFKIMMDTLEKHTENLPQEEPVSLPDEGREATSEIIYREEINPPTPEELKAKEKLRGDSVSKLLGTIEKFLVAQLPKIEETVPEVLKPKTWRDYLMGDSLEGRNGIDLETFAHTLLYGKISDLATTYVPSYVTPSNPESLVNLLAMIGYDVLNKQDAGIEFKDNQRMEISIFIRALEKISQAIDASKKQNESTPSQKSLDATIPEGVSILDFVEMIKKKIAGVESGK